MTPERHDSGADQSSTEAKVRTVVALATRRDVHSLQDRTRLFADLGLNSAGVLELLMLLERELDIRLDPGELEPGDLETVGSLTAYLVGSGAADPCT